MAVEESCKKIYKRQSTGDYDELPLEIPVSSLKQHLLCPICMSRINGSCMTNCGHRFCFKCIAEWVDRRHTCPCCSTTLVASTLIKDTGFDALLKTLREQETAAEKEYFKNLVENASCKEEERRKIESPLQVVLQKHLQLSLNHYETYHQELVADYGQGLSMISQRKHFLAQQVNGEFSHDPSHPDRLAKLADVEGSWVVKKQILEDKFREIQKMFAATFDGYLSENLPPPSTFPLNVKLTVPEKEFYAEVILKPEDNMDTITKRLRALMEEKYMAIREFPKCEDFEISIISPFALLEDVKESDAEESMKDFKEMVLTHQVLHPDCKPVLAFRINTGTEIRFKGEIVLERDVAKLCSATSYDGSPNKTVNYYWCKKCNIKWICEACSQICHREHASNVVPFIMNHRPNRAYCLCPKKSKCELLATVTA